jgi:hypothetical protein
MFCAGEVVVVLLLTVCFAVCSCCFSRFWGWLCCLLLQRRACTHLLFMIVDTYYYRTYGWRMRFLGMCCVRLYSQHTGAQGFTGAKESEPRYVGPGCSMHTGLMSLSVYIGLTVPHGHMLRCVEEEQRGHGWSAGVLCFEQADVRCACVSLVCAGTVRNKPACSVL